jgi:glycine cleavage system H lipoate-binding protein
MNLNFYTDSGHGWLAVKRDLLVTLGITHKISTYS